MTTPYEQAVRDLKAAREAQYAAREVMLMLKTEWKREDTEESFEAYLKAREVYSTASGAADAAEDRRRGCGSAYTNIRKH